MKKIVIEDAIKAGKLDKELMEVFSTLIKVLTEDTEEKETPAKEKPIEAVVWNKALTSLCEKTGWKAEKLDNIFTTLSEVNPWAALQFVLKEIAIELDKKYASHINDSETIYAISPQDGRIHEINKAHIKCYRAFPAFRTIEDAKLACRIAKNHLKAIFANV